LPLQDPSWYQAPGKPFLRSLTLQNAKDTHIENMINYFKLTTTKTIISLLDVPHLEIPSQNVMACAKLKQLTHQRERALFLTLFSQTFSSQKPYFFWYQTVGNGQCSCTNNIMHSLIYLLL